MASASPAERRCRPVDRRAREPLAGGCDRAPRRRDLHASCPVAADRETHRPLPPWVVVVTVVCFVGTYLLIAFAVLPH